MGGANGSSGIRERSGNYQLVAAELVYRWMNSNGHRENILRRGINYFGHGSFVSFDYNENSRLFNYQMLR
ncbi:MAG: hypothetical protein FWF50_04165 [Defluviitaleaceae bacterium]|nr:hypothetical protein [Defluviitaleaceae bacterium]